MDDAKTLHKLALTPHTSIFQNDFQKPAALSSIDRRDRCEALPPARKDRKNSAVSWPPETPLIEPKPSIKSLKALINPHFDFDSKTSVVAASPAHFLTRRLDFRWGVQIAHDARQGSQQRKSASHHFILLLMLISLLESDHAGENLNHPINKKD